jgi:peptidylprolyl isomerase
VAPLGQAQVIAGWNEGLIGAQAGSRRLLVIPPDQGYGSQGSGDAIAPNETLIFVVDVISIGPYTPPPASPSPSASPSS